MQNIAEHNRFIDFFTLRGQIFGQPFFKKILKKFRAVRVQHAPSGGHVVPARLETFVDKTLWPEFLELDKELTTHINETTERIINEAIFGDSSEAEEIRAIAHI